jgi:tetratricopeptide (TPR) repeat protein
VEEETFAAVREKIIRNDTETAVAMLSELASSSDDPFVKIKSASVLLAIGKPDVSDGILEDLYDNLPENPEKRFAAAQAMRGLGRPDLASEILSEMEKTDKVLREHAISEANRGNYSSAYGLIEKIENPSLDDRILAADSLSSSGKIPEALALSESIFKEHSDVYGAVRCRCGALIAADRGKEALALAKSLRKKDKNSPDAYAAGAYVTRIIGKSDLAGAFASKALRIDPNHLGAMEILAQSLMDREMYRDAGIVAGAINEKDPGNRIAVYVLKECAGRF